ncbi:MAG: H-type lectin domain-containing protein [Pseudomonadota bacterium]
MQIIGANHIGVQTGDMLLFSDFEEGGEMWKGDGARVVRRPVSFDQAFLQAPEVMVHMTMMDMSNEVFIRADLQAEAVTKAGFDIVFRTWGDSRVARIRAGWQAIGAIAYEDNWQL